MLQVDGTPPPPRLDAPRGSAAAAPAAASPSFEAASTRHARVAFGGPTLRLHRAPRMEMPPAPRPLTMKRYAAAARIARVRGARAWPPGCPHTCIPARVLGVRWQLHGALGGCSGGRQVASEAGCLGGHSGAAPREAQEHGTAHSFWPAARARHETHLQHATHATSHAASATARARTTAVSATVSVSAPHGAPRAGGRGRRSGAALRGGRRARARTAMSENAKKVSARASGGRAARCFPSR